MTGCTMEDETDPGEGRDSSAPLPVRRIRSGVRRRILERLTEGRATVTLIADDTGLRMPHASAELKRLRGEKLIASDGETGSRGACLALTSLGWEMLRADELARLAALPDAPPPEGALGRIVSVSEDQILIAFIRRPPEGPLALPNRPLEQMTGSSGDWIWVDARERRPRWFEPGSLRALPAPPSTIDTGHIGAWGAEAAVWGLQRFRSIPGSQPLRLASGAWFSELDDPRRVPLPSAVPEDGDWRLGAIGMDGPEVRPVAPVIAVGLDRLSREALLAAAAPEAATIAPIARSLARTRPLPLDLLDEWVERAHPRLRPADRVERLRLLREALAEPADPKLRRRLEESTWRRFRQHWGNSSWSANHLSNGDWIDTSTLSSMAQATLVDWSLNESEVSLVLEVPQTALDAFPSGHCPPIVRLILTEDWVTPPIADRMVSHPVLSAMWARLELHEGPHVPIHLAPPVSIAALTESVLWDPPTRAAEVEAAKYTLGGRKEGAAIPDLAPTESRDRLLRAAVLSHPVGDENWANRMEPAHPLIAWIASPAEDRWARWQRIGGGLGSGWIDLMTAEDIPVEALASAAVGAPPGWRRRLGEGTRARIRDDAEFAHQLRQSGEGAKAEEAGWIATILLSEIAYIVSEQQTDLVTWGVDRFLDTPPARSSDALAGLDWLSRQRPESLLAEPDDWRPRARDAGFGQNQDHDLHLWAVLEDWLVNGNRPHTAVMRLIVERLPEEWWASEAETLLSVLSEDAAGLAFLAEMDIAWPALILRPQDEEHELPGGSVHLHRGVRRTLLARLDRLDERVEWQAGAPGAKMITDLQDALQVGRDLARPSPGHCHPLVGWLAIPHHLWPPGKIAHSSEGDPRITARLARGASGWHPDLSRNPLDV